MIHAATRIEKAGHQSQTRGCQPSRWRTNPSPYIFCQRLMPLKLATGIPSRAGTSPHAAPELKKENRLLGVLANCSRGRNLFFTKYLNALPPHFLPRNGVILAKCNNGFFPSPAVCHAMELGKEKGKNRAAVPGGVPKRKEKKRGWELTRQQYNDMSLTPPSHLANRGVLEAQPPGSSCISTTR